MRPRPASGPPPTGRWARAGRALAAAVCALVLAACGREGGASRAEAPCSGVRAPADGGVGPRSGMVYLKGGAFVMGALPLRAEEGPARRAQVAPFWIDCTDVTNAAFARFVAATGYVTLAERPLDPRLYPQLSADQLKPSGIVFVGAPPGERSDPSRWWRVVPGANWRHPQGPGSSIAGAGALPVVQVGWEDARAYARWLGRDLPTEAEWEYAAQGGREPARYVWGNAPFSARHPQANVWQGAFPTNDTGADGYRARTSPVGCFPPNGYGLFDMAGNVWQWTLDTYPSQGRGAAGGSEGPEPDGPGPRLHVIKGGSFLCSADFCFRYRPAAREAGPSDTGESHIGFRTVLRLPPA